MLSSHRFCHFLLLQFNAVLPKPKPNRIDTNQNRPENKPKPNRNRNEANRTYLNETAVVTTAVSCRRDVFMLRFMSQWRFHVAFHVLSAASCHNGGFISQRRFHLARRQFRVAGFLDVLSIYMFASYGLFFFSLPLLQGEEGGGRTYSVACFRHLTNDHAFLSRRNTRERGAESDSA